MTPRTFADARRWMHVGTELLLDTVSGLDETALAQPSQLPGWSRKYLVAHVAANSDALQNLVTWASTGEETPMYASAAARAEGIERGSKLPDDELRAWLHSSAGQLEDAMVALTEEQWQTKVVTAQGRTVPATEIPWMRDRELFVHTVDLDHGATFADLPTDFLEALRADIVAKRGLEDSELPEGDLPEVVAWLAGRAHALVDVSDLGPWL